MKLPQLAPPRPMPRMPELTGHAPRFDTILGISVRSQPIEGIRPVYWWARELRRRGDTLVGLSFDPLSLTATVSVRLASYRVVTVVRRHDHAVALPRDLPTLIAEAVWRLGALGWTAELRALTELLVQLGLLVAPAPVRPSTRAIPGWISQPSYEVRVAFWWSRELKRRGWKLYACGSGIARGGFIAEIPNAAGDSDLVIYPGGMAYDGTEASALANHLARRLTRQRRTVDQLISDVGEGWVS